MLRKVRYISDHFRVREGMWAESCTAENESKYTGKDDALLRVFVSLWVCGSREWYKARTHSARRAGAAHNLFTPLSRFSQHPPLGSAARTNNVSINGTNNKHATIQTGKLLSLRNGVGFRLLCQHFKHVEDHLKMSNFCLPHSVVVGLKLWGDSHAHMHHIHIHVV